MAVYVDNAKHPFGRLLMCHMWADTRAELFAMADRIGVQRKWFQRPAALGLAGMDASWEHFDIAQSKHALAVAAGAVETDKYGPVAHKERFYDRPPHPVFRPDGPRPACRQEDADAPGTAGTANRGRMPSCAAIPRGRSRPKHPI